jgi:hypothetical protein
MINAYKILVGNPEGKRPFGRLIRRWEHNSKMDIMALDLGRALDYVWFRVGTSGGLL